MKNLFDYKAFLNEAKKEESPVSSFKHDVKNLLDDMFAKVKKPTYTFDDEGFPTHVKFEIEKADYGISYDKIECEFSEGVLKKRTVLPVLKYDKKSETKGDSPTYTIEFKISKDKVDASKMAKTAKVDQFEKDSDDQLLSKLKSKKTSDVNKEKIMKMLVDRGVDFKNPFDEDEDAEDEEEMDKKASKEAGAKKPIKESVEIKEDEICGKCKCNPCECEKCDCGKEKCECNESLELNEIMGGELKPAEKKKIISEILSKEELIQPKIAKRKEELEKMSDADLFKLFSKISKKENLTFGSEEWCAKYNISLEKEEKVEYLNALVSETLKIKKVEDMSLNEKVNQIYNDNIQSNIIPTEKK